MLYLSIIRNTYKIKVMETTKRSKGRPTVQGSKRQAILAEREAIKAANGGVLPRGRRKGTKNAPKAESTETES
jgi:hypothetical protein